MSLVSCKISDEGKKDLVADHDVLIIDPIQRSILRQKATNSNKRQQQQITKDITEIIQDTMNLFEKISCAPKKDTLRKKSQEILKLEYDKATKFFAMGSATSM